MRLVKLALVLASAVCFASCSAGGSISGTDSVLETQSKPDSVIEASLPEKSIKEQALEDYLELIAQTDYCAHALGGIDEHSYTNSLEALQHSYDSGARLYEADIELTSDGRAVLVHGFGKNDYKKRIGWEYYPDENKKSGEDYIPTHDEFMSWTIQGQYKPLDMTMLGDFIKAHPDMYVLADVWTQDYENTKAVYTAICSDCGYDELVLSHIIAGGHTMDMIKAIKEVYSFPILNLYYSDEMINDGFTPQDFINYCKSEGIQSFSCADEYFTEESFSQLKDSGLISYVFTINDTKRADEVLKSGADIVGSDFINLT